MGYNLTEEEILNKQQKKIKDDKFSFVVDFFTSYPKNKYENKDLQKLYLKDKKIAKEYFNSFTLEEKHSFFYNHYIYNIENTVDFLEQGFIDILNDKSVFKKDFSYSKPLIYELSTKNYFYYIINKYNIDLEKTAFYEKYDFCSNIKTQNGEIINQNYRASFFSYFLTNYTEYLKLGKEKIFKLSLNDDCNYDKAILLKLNINYSGFSFNKILQNYYQEYFDLIKSLNINEEEKQLVLKKFISGFLTYENVEKKCVKFAQEKKDIYLTEEDYQIIDSINLSKFYTNFIDELKQIINSDLNKEKLNADNLLSEFKNQNYILYSKKFKNLNKKEVLYFIFNQGLNNEINFSNKLRQCFTSETYFEKFLLDIKTNLKNEAKNTIKFKL